MERARLGNLASDKCKIGFKNARQPLRKEFLVMGTDIDLESPRTPLLLYQSPIGIGNGIGFKERFIF